MSGGEAPVALVTGGGQRIGAAIARHLAAAGFSVIVTYRSSRRRARETARRIGGTAWRLDLLHPERFGHFAARLERVFGRLDLLVHNAAVFPRTPQGSLTRRAFDSVFAVNLRAPLLLTERLLPLLRSTPGSPAVVLVGDAGAAALWPSYLPYCLSKIALEHAGAAWRRSLGPTVRVGMVRPGLALKPPGFSRAAWEALRARPKGKGGLDSPDKIAAAVLRFFERGGYNFR